MTPNTATKEQLLQRALTTEILEDYDIVDHFVLNLIRSSILNRGGFVQFVFEILRDPPNFLRLIDGLRPFRPFPHCLCDRGNGT
jgi:hypothetical protein